MMGKLWRTISRVVFPTRYEPKLTPQAERDLQRVQQHLSEVNARLKIIEAEALVKARRESL